LTLEDLCALPIPFALLFMHSSVQLDDKPVLGAVEVYNEPSYRMLAAKLEAA
jgi:hypothetical protein